MIIWRTDVENCPKDKPFLVVHPDWHNRKPCNYTFRVVEWQPLNKELDDEDPDQVFGFVYDYDAEYDFHYCCDDFEYWMEIPLRP